MRGHDVTWTCRAMGRQFGSETVRDVKIMRPRLTYDQYDIIYMTIKPKQPVICVFAPLTTVLWSKNGKNPSVAQLENPTSNRKRLYPMVLQALNYLGTHGEGMQYAFRHV